MERFMFISDDAELAENKLIILYIARNFGLPLTNKRFSQIIDEGNFFNFFLLQHLLEDLIEDDYLSKNLEIPNEPAYHITAKGIETLNFLLHKIPGGVRRYIDRLTEKNKNNVKRDHEVIAYVRPSESKGFISVLEILDSNSVLFSMQFVSATKKDALLVCENFKYKAEMLYSKITRELLE